MKRKLSIFLSVVVLLSLFTNVFAAETNNTTLNYNLTYNGENTVTVDTGTVITVVYDLENASADEDFTIQTVANEIYFDNQFFEYLGDEQIKKGDFTKTAKENVYSGDEHRIYFNGSHLNGQVYSSKQFMGSFKLKVKATSGSSVISSKAISAYERGEIKYNLTSTNLTVFVGNTPTELYTVKYINDGTVYKTVEIAGTMYVESSPTVPKDYKFLGWENEADGKLYKFGDEYNVTADTTFTAKWEKISSGNGNNSGNSGGTNRIDGENGNTAKPEQTTNHKPDIFTDEHYSYIVGRTGGYFYPDSDLTRAESAEMLYRLLDSEVRTKAKTTTNAFTDVKSENWFNISVSTLAELGVINGRTSEIFAPNEKITRAEFTTMMIRLSDISYEGEDLFTDISTHWAREYINSAASVDWVNGYDGDFRPDNSITRAEVVTLINRVLNRCPESKDDLIDNMITPPDNTDENAWYYLAVQEAVNSHNYKLKADGVHEKWTSLTKNPDWTNLNK